MFDKAAPANQNHQLHQINRRHNQCHTLTINTDLNAMCPTALSPPLLQLFALEAIFTNQAEVKVLSIHLMSLINHFKRRHSLPLTPSTRMNTKIPSALSFTNFQGW